MLPVVLCFGRLTPMAATDDSLNFLQMSLSLFGGLALFLFGMNHMTEVLKEAAGSGLRSALGKLTKNRFSAVATGSVVTAIFQSSSVTTVLLVGFMSAGLMTLQQSIGVIMGANIGSTVTAQIIAFKVAKYALALVGVGFAMSFVRRFDRVKQVGLFLMGLGLIFHGMGLMSDATSPLRDYPPFIDVMKQMDRPLLAILAGATFTAIVQSSALTTGVVIVLASQGFIRLEAGIAIAMGANIGTCATAMLASIGKPRPAVQAAVSHIIFNVIGVVGWFFFIDQLAMLVQRITPGSTADALPRQIANAHTIFNIANTVALIGFIGPFAALVRRIVPLAPTPTTVAKPQYLDDVYLSTPDAAIDAVCRELVRLGRFVETVIAKGHHAATVGDRDDLAKMIRMDEQVDASYRQIIDYLRRLLHESISVAQAQQIQTYMDAANYTENIGDTVERMFGALARDRIEQRVEMSDATRKPLDELCANVIAAYAKVNDALERQDMNLATEVIKSKADIWHLVDAADDQIAKRLSSRDADRVELFRLESDLAEQHRRVFYFARRIAKAIVGEVSEVERTKA